MGASRFHGSEVQYGAAIQRNVMTPMRDGVPLAMDLHVPALGRGTPAERFPAILERTPYGKDSLRSVITGRYFASRGYVCIFQDVRGRGESGGEWLHLFNPKDDAKDGYDTLAWIVQQPWSDGKVGTIGTSYTGATQQALAISNPPGLSAQFIIDCGYNYWTHGSLRSGGAFSLGLMMPFFFRMALESKEAQNDPEVKQALSQAVQRLPEWFGRLPLQRGASPLSLVPKYEEMFLEIARHGDYDAFWKTPGASLEEYIDDYPDVPVYFVTSWYGFHVWANTIKFNKLSHRLRSPVRLAIGPWLHGFEALEECWSGDADFGADAALDNVNDLRLKWFDHFLKGLHTDVLEGPPIRIFVMGGGSGRRNAAGRVDHGGRWRCEPRWPLERTQFLDYYLHASGSLSPDIPARDAAPRRFSFDPANPVPTVGGNGSGTPGIVAAGAFDQRGNPSRWFACKDALPLSARQDVLAFQTVPLEEPLEVVGPLEVHLWASSSAPDTDFTAKLIDVYPPSDEYPDGYAMNLCDGLVRARYRDSRERPEFLAPGKVYPFTVRLHATGNVFAKGHRIRLDISSSNFPWFDVNPNTGAPLWSSAEIAVAQQTIWCDGEHPSCLVLPVAGR